MTKLEELQNALKKGLEDATDKDQIDFITSINTLVEGVAEDQKTLETKNAEILTSYKEVVRHSSFIPAAGEKPDKPTGDDKPLDIDSFMKDWSKTHDSEGKDKNNG